MSCRFSKFVRGFVFSFRVLGFRFRDVGFGSRVRALGVEGFEVSTTRFFKYYF